MNQPIKIPLPLYTSEIEQQIADHNARVERIWLAKGSRCKPFKPSPSTVPAPGPDLSRVRPAAEHGGSLLEVLP